MKYEMAYSEITSKGTVVTKRKIFKTEAAMEKFIDKLAEAGKLYEVYGTREIA